jgi:hypothetical protein
MFSARQVQFTLLAFSLLAPGLGFASSIVVNGANCDAGACPTVDTLSSGAGSGSSIGSTPFSFTYVAGDGDWYGISGNYAASNPASGDTSMVFNVTAKYEGNGGVNSAASVSADTFTISDMQDFNLASSAYYLSYGTLNGYYTESTNSGIVGSAPATGSSWQAQLFYNGQALPVLGPFTGPGSASNGSGTALTGFGAATTLAADFVFTYDFAQGTAAGSGFTSTPEPGGMIPAAAIAILCLGFGAVRRSRVPAEI